MQQSVVKFYYFVLQTLLNMFRALLCPSSRARQTAVAASGFRMKVEVFSATVSLLVMGIVMPETWWAVFVQQSNKILQLIVASSWVFRVIEDARNHKP
jgi:hypothetical protein